METPSTQIIGIDSATQDTRLGLARASYVPGPGAPTLHEALVCGRDTSSIDTIARWIEASPTPTLLAIDAPLGWPKALGTSLAAHRAGAPLAAHPDVMFRRATDRAVHERLGKLPLEVGADRIARTAHAALTLLEALRQRCGIDIPLAWAPETTRRCAAIEVYPAATLLAHGLRGAGYKRAADVEARREILHALQERLDVQVDAATLERAADALDAAVCVLAGADFLHGDAVPPDDAYLARAEGWIWVKARAADRPA